MFAYGFWAAFLEMPLSYQIISLFAVGGSALVILLVAFFVVPDLWRDGLEQIETWLSPDTETSQPKGPRDVRQDSPDRETGVVRAARASLDAEARRGLRLPAPRVHGLSERIGGMEVGWFGVDRPRRTAKGFSRKG